MMTIARQQRFLLIFYQYTLYIGPIYEMKLDKFEDDVCIQNMYGHRDSQFTIFVEFPETMLTIDQQRSFVKDHLSIY